ncbi:conserved hypothetical protein [Haloferula helveola]|uniref:Mechanosensitive ion channel n=1 Tax=Haloferula helveola TaxID=490095 RepID=A0ABN6H4M5_9BACT|nr:conserved hypothetical protein [Haloferula helveola]
MSLPSEFSFTLRRIGVLILLLTAPLSLQAQEKDVPPAQTKSVAALESTLPLLKREKEELEALLEQLKSAPSDAEKEKIEAEIAEHRARIKELLDNFRTIASGVDEAAYFDERNEAVTLNEEFQEILQPLLHELRDATSAPREMEQLRDDLEAAQERAALANSAIQRLNELLDRDNLSDALREEITRTRDDWKDRMDEVNGRIDVIEAKMEERRLNSPTLLEAASEGLSTFWKSRGLNVLLAIVAFFVTFIVLRKLYFLFQRISPFHRKGSLKFTSRLVDLTAAALSILAALSATLIVFYLRGDWLLLTIAAILLAGLIIASRNSLPPYIDQIRTMLNLGSVREGERMMYDGIPWRVDRLGVYCHFTNPLLGGGTLRLPIRAVGDLHSRPTDKKEPWFPTKEGDWVVLGDEVYGKIVQQTPERITVLKLGGSRKVYPSADFLSLSPENLSTGFRVTTVFGIDYAHQEFCTTEAPGIFQKYIENNLIETFGHDVLHNLNVEFSAAGASSLDYTVLADFTGEAAPRYKAIQRRLQKLCVDVCNEQGWTIPFTQITLHQA